jgi:hypothetical protein
MLDEEKKSSSQSDFFDYCEGSSFAWTGNKTNPVPKALRKEPTRTGRQVVRSLGQSSCARQSNLANHFHLFRTRRVFPFKLEFTRPSSTEPSIMSMLPSLEQHQPAG